MRVFITLITISLILLALQVYHYSSLEKARIASCSSVVVYLTVQHELSANGMRDGSMFCNGFNTRVKR